MPRQRRWQTGGSFKAPYRTPSVAQATRCVLLRLRLTQQLVGPIMMDPPRSARSQPSESEAIGGPYGCTPQLLERACRLRGVARDATSSDSHGRSDAQLWPPSARRQGPSDLAEAAMTSSLLPLDKRISGRDPTAAQVRSTCMICMESVATRAIACRALPPLARPAEALAPCHHRSMPSWS